MEERSLIFSIKNVGVVTNYFNIFYREYARIDKFCFQITDEELKILRFQIGTSKDNVLSNNFRGGRRYLPYVFTEQGIAMLAGVLKNEIAISVSINIIKSFIEMRKVLNSNGQIFERLINVEHKLLEYDKKFDKVFNQLQQEETIKQQIFFQGQIYDAYKLLIDIIKKANTKIVIIDNYIDDTILEMLTKKKKDVEVIILTSNKSKIKNIDIQKFNQEYPTLKLGKTNKFHDRFIIIDKKELYHCGASLKDLGKKCFAINKMEDIGIIEKLIDVEYSLNNVANPIGVSSFEILPKEIVDALPTEEDLNLHIDIKED